MTTGGGIEVRGADRLARTLRAAGDDLGKLTAANAAAGRVMAGGAKAAAPKRSGRLAGSITAKPEPAGVTVTAGVVYAGVIHFGWARRGITGRPYLKDGIDRTQPAWLPLYAREIRKTLDQVKGT